MRKTKKPEEPKTIVIPPINVKLVRITIVGSSPLLINRFDEKSRQEIEDSYRKVARNKKIPKTVEQEFEDALYRMPGKKKYGIPASGLKNCAVTACKFIEGIAMTEARGAFHVLEDANGLCELKCSAPAVDRRTVRVGNFGNKKPATRTRPRFDKWECTFTVKYRPDVITAEQLLNLYENAGFSVGLCEYRPEKNGNLGMFEVKRK